MLRCSKETLFLEQFSVDHVRLRDYNDFWKTAKLKIPEYSVNATPKLKTNQTSFNVFCKDLFLAVGVQGKLKVKLQLFFPTSRSR